MESPGDGGKGDGGDGGDGGGAGAGAGIGAGGGAIFPIVQYQWMLQYTENINMHYFLFCLLTELVTV